MISKLAKTKQKKKASFMNRVVQKKNIDDSGSARNSSISLFLPFYSPPDLERRQEIERCLRNNLNGSTFCKIYLLQNDNAQPPFEDKRIKSIYLNRRPTYLDWVKQSKIHCPNTVSVLANSDIWFNDSIGLLSELFTKEPRAFVALSRHENVAGEILLHENPQWSQDTWAFYSDQEISPSMEKQLDIQLGIPRCDNKVAYVFSVNGFSVYNPCNQIVSVHEHQSNFRYYEKKVNADIMGGVVMVHPSLNLSTPSDLGVEVWSLSSKQYKGIKFNRSLEVWKEDLQREKETNQCVFGYDADWQYPAITEKHAFYKMIELSPQESQRKNIAYIGFPWATLIDLMNHQADDIERINSLLKQLHLLMSRVGERHRIVTVCQHINLIKFLHIFKAAGVTDIFWSHATKVTPEEFEKIGIEMHPFPLFPVQEIKSTNKEKNVRPYLFSFVGARSTSNYISQSRNIIIDKLASDERGKVVSRDAWHYEKIVYQKQIAGSIDGVRDLVDKDAADEFQEIMSKSLFTLCPSGSGPNSIRLWEAAINGSIPVVLADTFQHPGDACLWDKATVRCAESEISIIGLPDSLSAIASDLKLLRSKQSALSELSHRYGPCNFVLDIVEFIDSNPPPLLERECLVADKPSLKLDDLIFKGSWFANISDRILHAVSHIELLKTLKSLFRSRSERRRQRKAAKALARIPQVTR